MLKRGISKYLLPVLAGVFVLSVFGLFFLGGSITGAAVGDPCGDCEEGQHCVNGVCEWQSCGNYILGDYDCDDNDFNTNPSATEACGDGRDNNCNGQIDEGCTGVCNSDWDCGICQECQGGG